MRNPEIAALLDKAKQSVDAARGLLSDGYFDFSVSRAYYAMFYVAEALLLQVGQSYSKHAAVIAAYGREYAKSGRLEAKFHRRLIDAQDFRNIGDYGIGAHVSSEEAESTCQWAAEFIEAGEAFLAR